MPHLFMSYSRQNQAAVERLRHDLQQATLNIWIDRIGLQPGTPDWDEALRKAIREADAVLLIASPDSRRSAYVRDEIALAKAANKPIYPLWMDGNDYLDCIPLGLGSTQNIDLRGDDYARNLPRLIGALIGTANVAETVEPIAPITVIVQEPDEPPPAQPRNPYKGLRAFRPEDAGDFFGRDTLITDLLAQVEDIKRPARLLAILGASGSGKSSVMMAGVLPKLREKYRDWIFLDPMVPGANPLEKLIITLARRFENKSQTAIREDLLDRTTRGLHGLVCELSDKPVILYIDQFEELFTLVNSESDRRHFIDLLTTAVTDPGGVLFLLLSMRADFYDRPAQYREFGVLLEKHHTLITPMTLADLYDVVQNPAELPDVRLRFDDGLATEMVFAVREEAAALPLLQFTLDQLFDRREGNTLTMSAYTTIGGIQGALAQHAETTYANLPSDQHRTLARALFLRLIEPGQTEQDTTRRRAAYSEFTLPDAEQTRILAETTDAFVNARLLVTDSPRPEGERMGARAANPRTLEVSHEALIREWERLGEWLHSARENLRLQKSLSADVSEWLRRGKPEDMLYRGRRLRDALDWTQTNTASADEANFIAAGEAVEQAQFANEEQRKEELKQAEKRAVQARREAQEIANHAELQRHRAAAAARRARNAIIAAVVLIVISVSIGAFAGFQTNTANNAQEQVETQVAALNAIVPGATRGASLVQILIGSGSVMIETNLQWSPYESEFDGVSMVLVPPGCFDMGSQDAAFAASPIHKVCFDSPFWIDRAEVTNGQYGSSGQWGRDDLPRETISWERAKLHCEQRNARLPTEAEWEYAARGPDSLIYPWGNDFIGNNVVYAANSSAQTASVGSRLDGVSWVGAVDLSGNVWEWTSSQYEVYPYKQGDGREADLDNSRIRVLRGGSWYNEDFVVRAANRDWGLSTHRSNNIGFRCARSQD